MSKTTNEITLVLGGTGKTGRRVAERLRARGIAVRIGSRSGAPAFDWHDRAAWAAVLEQVGAVYIAYHPDLAVPGAAETVSAFARLARNSGVTRLVLLSGRGEEEALRAEAAVRAAHPATTVVRCSWFAQNFSESFLLDAVRSGTIALPIATGVFEPFIDADDIADVAVAALTQPGHAGETYELTGPAALSFEQVAAELERASGTSVRFVPISVDTFTAGLSEAGTPAEMTALLVYLMTEVLDGRNAATADGVQRALGRAPRSFRDYATDAANSGAWTSVPGGAGRTAAAAGSL